MKLKSFCDFSSQDITSINEVVAIKLKSKLT